MEQPKKIYRTDNLSWAREIKRAADVLDHDTDVTASGKWVVKVEEDPKEVHNVPVQKIENDFIVVELDGSEHKANPYADADAAPPQLQITVGF